MSLTEAALAAHKTATAEAQEKREQQRDAELQKALERWSKAWHDYSTPPRLMEGLDAVPEIEKHQRGKLQLGIHGEIADVLFIWSEGRKFAIVTGYNRSYEGSVLFVRTCPDCDGEFGERFYNIAGIGALIQADTDGRRARSTTHTCYQSAVKRVAATLKTEAQFAKTSAEHLAQLALQDLASRGFFR